MENHSRDHIRQALGLYVAGELTVDGTIDKIQAIMRVDVVPIRQVRMEDLGRMGTVK